jgi:hypothetical protein
LPSTFVRPGVQAVARARAPADKGAASRRAMQAERTISSGRLRGRP